MLKIKNLISLMALLAIFTNYCAQESKEDYESAASSSSIQFLDQSNNASLKIISLDSKAFKVPFNIAMQSNLIKTAHEGDPQETEIPVNINSDLLKPLLEAIKLLYPYGRMYDFFQENPSQKIMYEYIQGNFFKDFNLDQLAQAFQAAIYLDFPKLENVFADKIAQLITDENVTKIINVISREHLFLIEKFRYLRSSELRPGKLAAKFIKQWNLSINDLVDYKEIVVNHVLNLSNFYLVSLDGLQRISGLNNLKYLNLSYNQITELGDSFAGLNNLVELNLSNNQITELGDSLKNLNKLRILDLSNNRITSLGNSLNNLNNLKGLLLNNNQLTELGNNSFQGLNELRVLRLFNNQLTELSNNNFNGLNNLQRLYLHNNPLNDASKELLIQLRERVTFIHF